MINTSFERIDVRVICLLLISFSLALPLCSAAVDSEEGGGELWFSCDDISNCNLTEYHTGEASVGGSVNSASPINPETILIELPMAPSQSDIALLPEVIQELQVDLRYQDDVIGLTRPDLEVTIIIAQSTTKIEFEGDNNPIDGISGPHRIEDETLNLNGDRLLWPDEEIRILLQFQVERPGNWELNLRGSSFMILNIIWSENIDSRDIDEPSSDSSPVQTELDTVHYGALVDDDRDCWTFEVYEHELLKITFEWEEVPSEIEQNHGRPDLILPDRRLAPTPELQTEVVNGETKVTWQWRALPTGEYDMCIGGKLNSFQPYKWIGLTAFESLGPTSPDEFNYESWAWPGLGMKGDSESAVNLESSSGIIPLILSLAVIVGLTIELRKNSTSKPIRYGLFVPGIVILLLGGVISPLWTLTGEISSSDEKTLDELIDDRLEQLWHASHPATPPSSRAIHVGSTFGMLEGEIMSLRLEASEAWPLDDGRWQLYIPEIYELDIESLIFNKVAKKSTNSVSDNLLDSHSRNFILLSARTVVLDLLMLEALLVVDDIPDSKVIKIETEMVKSQSFGLLQDPVWGTKPADIPENRWRFLQENLYPNLIAIIMLDGDSDDLEFRIQTDFEIQHSMMYSSTSVTPSGPLLDSNYLWIIGGVILAGLGLSIENRRRSRAKKMLIQMVEENKWN